MIKYGQGLFALAASTQKGAIDTAITNINTGAEAASKLLVRAVKHSAYIGPIVDTFDTLVTLEQQAQLAIKIGDSITKTAPTYQALIAQLSKEAQNDYIVTYTETNKLQAAYVQIKQKGGEDSSVDEELARLAAFELKLQAANPQKTFDDLAVAYSKLVAAAKKPNTSLADVETALSAFSKDAAGLYGALQ